MLDKSRQSIDSGKGLTADDFWKAVEMRATKKGSTPGNRQKRAKPGK